MRKDCRTPARSSTEVSVRARSKKLERRRTGSNNKLFRPDEGCGGKKSPQPSSGRKKGSACRIAKRHERHQTRAQLPRRNYGNWSAALASFARCKPRHCTNQRLATRSSRAAHSPWARPTRWAFKALGSPTHNEDVRASTMLPSLLQHQSHAQTRVPQAAAAAMCSEGYRPEL